MKTLVGGDQKKEQASVSSRGPKDIRKAGTNKSLEEQFQAAVSLSEGSLGQQKPLAKVTCRETMSEIAYLTTELVIQSNNVMQGDKSGGRFVSLDDEEKKLIRNMAKRKYKYWIDMGASYYWRICLDRLSAINVEVRRYNSRRYSSNYYANVIATQTVKDNMKEYLETFFPYLADNVDMRDRGKLKENFRAHLRSVGKRSVVEKYSSEKHPYISGRSVANKVLENKSLPDPFICLLNNPQVADIKIGVKLTSRERPEVREAYTVANAAYYEYVDEQLQKHYGISGNEQKIDSGLYRAYKSYVVKNNRVGCSKLDYQLVIENLKSSNRINESLMSRFIQQCKADENENEAEGKYDEWLEAVAKQYIARLQQEKSDSGRLNTFIAKDGCFVDSDAKEEKLWPGSLQIVKEDHCLLYYKDKHGVEKKIVIKDKKELDAAEERFFSKKDQYHMVGLARGKGENKEKFILEYKDNDDVKYTKVIKNEEELDAAEEALFCNHRIGLVEGRAQWNIKYIDARGEQRVETVTRSDHIRAIEAMQKSRSKQGSQAINAPSDLRQLSHIVSSLGYKVLKEAPSDQVSAKFIQGIKNNPKQSLKLTLLQAYEAAVSEESAVKQVSSDSKEDRLFLAKELQAKVFAQWGQVDAFSRATLLKSLGAHSYEYLLLAAKLLSDDSVYFRGSAASTQCEQLLMREDGDGGRSRVNPLIHKIGSEAGKNKWGLFSGWCGYKHDEANIAALNKEALESVAGISSLPTVSV